MHLKDEFKIHGYISLDIHDKIGNLVDHWEEHNLIVDIGRVNVASVLAGLAVGRPIDKLVFGSMGNKTNDPLTPKTSIDGFDVSRTMLFSEQSATVDDKGNGAWYSMVFEPPYVTGNTAIIGTETFRRRYNTTNPTNTGITITVTQTNKQVTYTIVVPTGAMFDPGTDYKIMPISEVGLYCGGDLFAMKCFPTRLKTEDAQLTLNWTIYF